MSAGPRTIATNASRTDSGTIQWLDPFKVVALIAVYNEADIIGAVVSDLIDQGVMVYLIDHGSTDGTVAAVEPYLDKGVIAIEQFLDDGGNPSQAFQWEQILKRKEALADELDAHWFIHQDADEFRESPWQNRTLAQAIKLVDRSGYNAIDFQVFNFWPTHDGYRAGDDPRTAFPSYAPGESFNKIQIRCWKKTTSRVDIATSGGHDATFPSRRVFPIRFILRHYPIRSQQHGERKVFAERRGRFVATERERGWHVQYDGVLEGDSFVRDAATLTTFDGDAVRLQLMVQHRGVEELESRTTAAEQIAHDLTSQQAAAERLIDTLNREVERLGQDALARAQEASRLLNLVEDALQGNQRLGAELNASRAESGQLAKDLARAEAEVHRLSGSVAEATGELERLGTELSVATSRRAQDRADLETAARHAEMISRELQQAQSALDGAHRRGQALELELASAHHHIRALLSSASWRWMAPLRAAGRLVMRSTQ